MTYNNKFVPQAPKTYEVRYVELKEPSKISTIAGYLSLSQVSCSSNSSGKEVSKTTTSTTVTTISTTSTTAEIAAAVAKAMSEVAAQNKGDKVESKTTSSGETTTTYHSNK